jgi:hypothetical protein
MHPQCRPSSHSSLFAVALRIHAEGLISCATAIWSVTGNGPVMKYRARWPVAAMHSEPDVPVPDMVCEPPVAASQLPVTYAQRSHSHAKVFMHLETTTWPSPSLLSRSVGFTTLVLGTSWALVVGTGVVAHPIRLVNNSDASSSLVQIDVCAPNGTR